MDKIRSRHASYFLALTQKVHDKRTDADAGQWLAVLDGEYANWVAALKGLRERNEIRQLVSFETLIAQYRYIRGLIGEGRDGLERALALGADEGLSSVAAYCSCSEFARLQGDHDAAKQHAETALGLARGDGSPDEDEGVALKQLGIIEMFDDLEGHLAGLGTRSPGRCVRDGQVLFDAVVEHGLEGIVAKRRDGLYRSGQRGWVKVKNPNYWRRESEIELVQRQRERLGARQTANPA
jgi:hypothetical protein